MLDLAGVAVMLVSICLVAYGSRYWKQVLGIGGYLLWKGTARSGSDVKDLLLDPRRPVFWMRPFQKDGELPSGAFKNGFKVLIFSPMSSLETTEASLKRLVKTIGPLVSIGRPSEAEVPEGGYRIYTSDEEWRDLATLMINQAQAVVARVGTGSNVIFEVESAFRLGCERKLFLLIVGDHNFSNEQIYQQFRAGCSADVQRSLPNAIGRARVLFKDGEVFRGIAPRPTWKRFHIFPSAEIDALQQALVEAAYLERLSYWRFFDFGYLNWAANAVLFLLFVALSALLVAIALSIKWLSNVVF